MRSPTHAAADSSAECAASRLESHGTPGRIQVTAETAERLAHAFRFEPRGTVELKGKGAVEFHYLVGRMDEPGAGTRLTSGPPQS